MMLRKKVDPCAIVGGIEMASNSPPHYRALTFQKRSAKKKTVSKTHFKNRFFQFSQKLFVVWLKYLGGGCNFEVFKSPRKGLTIALTLILRFSEKTRFFGHFGAGFLDVQKSGPEVAKKSCFFKKSQYKGERNR